MRRKGNEIMAKQNGLEFIYVLWQDLKSRNNFTIGTLTRNGHYQFKYGIELEKAKQHGFMPLVSFPDFDEVYQDERLFPAFACRLPDAKRRDIAAILHKYGLTEFDEFELLKKSGAKLPTDTLSFADPIFDDEGTVIRTFYIAGVRHYLACKGEDCSLAPGFTGGTELQLCLEPDNAYDENAVQIKTAKGDILLGYVPRCYSEAVSKRLKRGMSYTCRIMEHNCGQLCGECLKVQLQMPAAQDI